MIEELIRQRLEARRSKALVGVMPAAPPVPAPPLFSPTSIRVIAARAAADAALSTAPSLSSSFGSVPFSLGAYSASHLHLSAPPAVASIGPDIALRNLAVAEASARDLFNAAFERRAAAARSAAAPPAPKSFEHGVAPPPGRAAVDAGRFSAAPHLGAPPPTISSSAAVSQPPLRFTGVAATLKEPLRTPFIDLSPRRAPASDAPVLPAPESALLAGSQTAAHAHAHALKSPPRRESAAVPPLSTRQTIQTNTNLRSPVSSSRDLTPPPLLPPGTVRERIAAARLSAAMMPSSTPPESLSTKTISLAVQERSQSLMPAAAAASPPADTSMPLEASGLSKVEAAMFSSFFDAEPVSQSVYSASMSPAPYQPPPPAASVRFSPPAVAAVVAPVTDAVNAPEVSGPASVLPVARVQKDEQQHQTPVMPEAANAGRACARNVIVVETPLPRVANMQRSAVRRAAAVKSTEPVAQTRAAVQTSASSSNKHGATATASLEQTPKVRKSRSPRPLRADDSSDPAALSSMIEGIAKAFNSPLTEKEAAPSQKSDSRARARSRSVSRATAAETTARGRSAKRSTSPRAKSSMPPVSAILAHFAASQNSGNQEELRVRFANHIESTIVNKRVSGVMAPESARRGRSGQTRATASPESKRNDGNDEFSASFRALAEAVNSELKMTEALWDAAPAAAAGHIVHHPDAVHRPPAGLSEAVKAAAKHIQESTHRASPSKTSSSLSSNMQHLRADLDAQMAASSEAASAAAEKARREILMSRVRDAEQRAEDVRDAVDASLSAAARVRQTESEAAASHAAAAGGHVARKRALRERAGNALAIAHGHNGIADGGASGKLARVSSDARSRETSRAALAALRSKSDMLKSDSIALQRSLASISADATSRNTGAISAACATLSRSDADLEVLLGTVPLVTSIPVDPAMAPNELLSAFSARAALINSDMAVLRESDAVVSGGARKGGRGGENGAARLAERVAKARAAAASADARFAIDRAELEAAVAENKARLDQIGTVVSDLRSHYSALRDVNSLTQRRIDTRLAELADAKRAAKRLQIAIDCGLPLSPIASK